MRQTEHYFNPIEDYLSIVDISFLKFKPSNECILGGVLASQVYITNCPEFVRVQHTDFALENILLGHKMVGSGWGCFKSSHYLILVLDKNICSFTRAQGDVASYGHTTDI